MPPRAREPHRLRRHPDAQRGEEDRIRHTEGPRRCGRVYNGQTRAGIYRVTRQVGNYILFTLTW